MDREDGINAGHRGIGRFFTFAIPAVLGMAASVWLGVWITAHGFLDTLSQEQRRAVFVGAEVKPKDPLVVEVVRPNCLVITRVDVAGSLAIYTRNDCGRVIEFPEWKWQEVSADGTVVEGGYVNTAFCQSPGPEMKSECVVPESIYYGYHHDDRAVKILVWVELR